MDPRYPIGKFVFDQPHRAEWISDIESLPARLRAALAGLGDAQLDTPYREGGWTVRQLVHHVADSHINAYLRLRFALTEDTPTIKPYFEERWAELADARSLPVEVSLDLLTALHLRWATLLHSLTEEQWARAFDHPDNGRTPLDKALGLYAWHGRHHTAHVTELRRVQGW
jgi:uncharacterized damage-inducible protein DinB